MLAGAQPQGALHFLHWPSLRLQKNTVGISLLLQFTDRNKASLIRSIYFILFVFFQCPSVTIFLLFPKIKQKRLRAGLNFNFTLFNRDLNLPDEWS